MVLRTPLIFLLGLVVGMAVRTGVAQERRLPGVNGINHLAFATPKYAEMMQFYTQTLGFPEAFSRKGPTASRR